MTFMVFHLKRRRLNTYSDSMYLAPDNRDVLRFSASTHQHHHDGANDSIVYRVLGLVGLEVLGLIPSSGKKSVFCITLVDSGSQR